MLNMVAAAEGVEKELVVGTLYYSGCKLSQHVKFLQEDSPVYQLYLSSSATPNNPPTIMENITMQMALRQDCWDIILLQGGSSVPTISSPSARFIPMTPIDVLPVALTSVSLKRIHIPSLVTRKISVSLSVVLTSINSSSSRN